MFLGPQTERTGTLCEYIDKIRNESMSVSVQMKNK